MWVVTIRFLRLEFKRWIVNMAFLEWTSGTSPLLYLIGRNILISVYFLNVENVNRHVQTTYQGATT